MSFASLLERSFVLHRDRLAIDFEGEQLSYGDLDREVAARVRWLASQGVRRGDRVALWLDKGLEFVFCHLANLRYGSVTLPINPTCSQDEARHCLADAQARLLIAPASRQIPIPAANGAVAIVPGLAAVLYTSGTTGKPKGAMLTHGNLAANCEALHRAWRWTEHDVLLHALPLFHVHGLFVALHGALRAGATVVMTARFDAARTLELIAAKQCTVFMGVPTMYHRLLQVDATRDVAHVRLFACGSAPLGIELARRFRERFGVPLVERYGMTEVGIATSSPLAQPIKDGSVGVPLPGVQIRVVDRATQQRVAHHVVGEVEIGGASVFAGYLGNDASTRAALTEDGFMRSGDLGYLDEDGHLFLVGRCKELIITGGLNVYPREVEAALETHAGVLEAAVFGVPDAEFGEAVIAAVVLAPVPGVTLAALNAHARARLAPYKCPKQIVAVPALPRNAMGKIDQARLAQSIAPRT
ncbi:MAG: acyl-CoA synthetase [Planctomycetota bacterium]